MDTELLRTFLEVERTRHFGRAAENLYLTQAAVSSRIRQLENTLGVSLFNRHRNNINLTPAGERLKPHAEAVITSWNRAIQESSLGSHQTLQIAIGGPPNLWDSLLQEYLHQLYHHLPGIALRAIAHDRVSLIQQLLSHTMDIALMFDPPKVEELQTLKIQTINLLLVSSYPNMAFEQIFDHSYIQVDWGTSFNIKHSQLQENTVPPMMHTSSGRIALDFMLENGGSCYLPESIAKPYIDSEKLYLIPQAPTVSRDVYSAYLKSTDKKETLETVVALFAAVEPIAAGTLQPQSLPSSGG